MGAPFRPLPLAALARWLFDGIESGETVLGIPLANLEVPGPRLAASAFGRPLAAPLGLAAGPHTQLAPNIVAGWLCGARFVELKTVQELDAIEVSRPCIDAADEAYNCEWSQELTLTQSFGEYLNAWVLVHALAHRLGLPGPGTHFAMSVGYTLDGIRSPRVSGFVEAMRDASAFLPAAVDAVAAVYPAVRDVEIPSRISDHVTLSTMHGCPPAEIERIARHLLSGLGLHTWVKLNPTLLGPDRLRGLLNRDLGWGIEVPDEAFAHDPRLPEALEMARSLASAAREAGRSFGIKLSNTLEVANRRGVLPSHERTAYLSGRALHPLTLTLAKELGDGLDGAVPISFCGGADATSFPDLVADGLSPVTVCTDLLKPGGYARLQQYLVNLEDAMTRAGAEDLASFVDATSGGKGARLNLARHAARVAADPRYAAPARPPRFKGQRPLGAFDCIAAPCQEDCPAHQNVPDYLWLVAQGRPGEALDVVLRTNPLPGITGSVCDHPCTERCVRSFYDSPLAIREVKRFAFEHGERPRAPGRPAAPDRPGPSVAIVGAGPAGLAAAYHLVRMGLSPEILEARGEAGGMVSGVIPGYRLSGKALGNDLERLRQLGVAIRLGTALGRDVSLRQLLDRHAAVFLAVGAQRGRRLGVPGEEAGGVVDALELLARVRAARAAGPGAVAGAPGPPDLGRRVLVVGGGNSAMDAARSARRLAPGAEVTLVYRRTRAEMPADPAEVRDALAEGVCLRELLAPARVVAEGGRAVALACTPMVLGEPDPSGRRRPVPSGEREVLLPADAIVTAVGQEAVLDFLDGPDGAQVARRPDGTLRVDPVTLETSVPGLFAGGDVVRGAASVVEALADGLAVAGEIGRRHGFAPAPEPPLPKGRTPAQLLARKGWRTVASTVPVLPVPQRGGFAEVVQSLAPDDAVAEASRCLGCDDLCSLCVTVCPNRANQAFELAPLTLDLPVLESREGELVVRGSRPFAVTQGVQVLNVADLCNACGSCTAFCPTAGRPFVDKPRVWLDREGYDASREDAFRFDSTPATRAVEARLGGTTHRLERSGDVAVYRTGALVARFDAASWRLLDARTEGAAADGAVFDLGPVGTLAALLHAERSLPRPAAPAG